MEGKREIRFFSKMIGFICLLLMLLAAGIVIVASLFQKGLLMEPAKVAMVIPEEEKETRVITRYAATMDSVKSVCTFEYYDSEEVAMDDLREGIVQACMVFPNHFFEDVDQGVNTPAKIYVRDYSKLSTRLFVQLLREGVSFLQVSEAGVYATLDTAKVYHAPVSLTEIGNELMEVYAYSLLERSNLFRKERVSPIGVLSLQKYLFAAILLLGMLLPGLFLGGLYRKQQRVLEQKLKVAGVSYGVVSFARIGLISLFLWGIALLIYTLGCLLTSFGSLNLVHFHPLVCMRLWLVALALSGLYHGVFSAFGDRMGVMVCLWLEICVVLCSGMIIPTSFLPKYMNFVERVLNFLPESVFGSLFETIGIACGGKLFAMWCVGLGVGALGRWKRL